MKRLILIVLMAGCGEAADPHEVVGSFPHERACENLTQIYDQPACTAVSELAENAPSEVECDDSFVFEGVRGCCVIDGEPSDPLAVTRFYECEEQ